jgi:hypothetical protein
LHRVILMHLAPSAGGAAHHAMTHEAPYRVSAR